MKPITDDELMDLPLALLVPRMSIFSNSIAGVIENNSISKLAQGGSLAFAYCGFGLTGALIGHGVGMWLPLAFVGGLALGLPFRKRMTKFFFDAIPAQRVAAIRKRLARIMDIEKLHHPMALLVVAAYQRHGIKDRDGNALIARWEAGELDSLEFAAQLLAHNPGTWYSTTHLVYEAYFQQSELIITKAQQHRSVADKIVEDIQSNGSPFELGVNFSTSYQLS